MTPKEQPPKRESSPKKEQPRQYDPSSLFELSAAEQEVFDRLTPSEQTIFSVFRQTFLLSSGDIPTQGTIIVAATNFFDLETKMLFSSYDKEKVPNLLQVIAAPRKHVRTGKKEVGDEAENSERQKGLLLAWQQWHTAFLEYMDMDNDYDKNIIKLESLVDFMDRDFWLLSRERTDRRVTGNQPHTSFLREFVLNNQFDLCFDIHLILLLQSWRELLVQHLVFYNLYIKNKSISEEIFAESELWLNDKEKKLPVGQDLIQVEAGEKIPLLVQLFFQEFGKYPTYLDSTIMEVFDGIVTGWQLKHPNQKFYEPLGF